MILDGKIHFFLNKPLSYTYRCKNSSLRLSALAYDWPKISGVDRNLQPLTGSLCPTLAESSTAAVPSNNKLRRDRDLIIVNVKHKGNNP